MKLTGKDGVLRIYDGSEKLHGAAPFAGYTVDMVKFDGVTTYTNITTDVDTDDASFASAFLTDNNDAVFVGSKNVFAMVQFLKDAGTNYAIASGALLAYYFDGTDFSNALTGVVDGTASAGDCFAQDGNITFKIPDDWAIGANIVSSDLDTDKYYIKLMTTTSSSTDPDADVLCPIEGQYFEVGFSNMDFTGQMGRPKTEEQLVLNRARSDSYAHYIEGADDRIFEPVPISFSFLMDDVINRRKTIAALVCANPVSTYWPDTGVTTKGTTKNDGTNLSPAFKDSGKKTVNIQMLFTGTSTNQGWSHYAVFFPEDEQTLTESEDGTIMNCNGGVFGVIERIHGFGLRYA